MSQLLINDYLKQLDVIRKVSGSQRETIVREAFKDLLKAWGRQHDLVFLAEYPIKTATKTNIAVDGALLHELRMPLGYWEAKDADDDLGEEIAKKFKKGYPQDNIVFSDDTTVVLIQHRQEVLRCEVADTTALAKLLKLFFSFERPEIAGFRAAVEQFKTDLPAVLDALRQMIETAHDSNPSFRAAEDKFLVHAQEAINPALTDADVREMLIQHILTEEIFAKVFDDSDFHQHNNVARELYALEGAFFTGALKRQTLRGLDSYYAAIRAAAAQIGSHGEKQTFLKVIYENFYKVYNTKAADRLGVVYTPNEIVRFMIDGADWLCEKHFGKNLIDQGVDILDPATGTGKGARKITKEAIFHYCYAVLHDPLYREKYAQNLKREFPRIPFYAPFWQWAAWGEQLMALHIGYEAVEPFALTRVEEPDIKARAAGQSPKALLRSDPAAGSITLDSETTLRGVPPQAWAYKLGNRCAIDWVLDQHKEKKPKDPTIRERFNTYRFADHKEKVVDLLQRVTTVSVETVRITEATKAVAR